jgi:hypothetical protein
LRRLGTFFGPAVAGPAVPPTSMKQGEEHLMSEEALSPPEFKARVEELQTLLTQKISELEENAEWGTPEEREELAQALDDLGVQIEALSDALQVIED